MQLLEYVEIQRRKRRLTFLQVWELRVKLAVPCVALACVAVAIIMPTGYFGPLSSRIRGLFLKHTRTGNPLVDSVAEHQPGSTRMYHQYLHHVFYLVPIGFVRRPHPARSTEHAHACPHMPSTHTHARTHARMRR